MVFQLDASINPSVAPLAWLVGSWSGLGVIGYPGLDSHNFHQEVEITHNEQPYLTMRTRTWKLDGDGEQVEELDPEMGYWRVLASGEVELLVVHPSGILEMYVGRKEAERPVIEMATDGVMRSPEAPEYNSGKRMYGLVESKLMWVHEMAARGQAMAPYQSAQLERVA